MYVGRGASRVRSLFQRARAAAAAANNGNNGWMPNLNWINGTSSHKRPGLAIIFIDELDALAKSRTFGGMTGNDERDQTLNQLLAEMDGFSSSTSSSSSSSSDFSAKESNAIVIVIGATNRPGKELSKEYIMIQNKILYNLFLLLLLFPPKKKVFYSPFCNCVCCFSPVHSVRNFLFIDCLDPAILRRFDRQIHVPYPNQEGRREILKIHAREVHCDIDGLDWEKYASDTDNFSGSDLRNLVNDAALIAVRRASKHVEDFDFEVAVERAKAMKGSFDMTRFTLPVL